MFFTKVIIEQLFCVTNRKIFVSSEELSNFSASITCFLFYQKKYFFDVGFNK
ncbi:hypothetical protein FCR2A7T_05970 [Flavobacterium cauense R2A-7]|nr:hypothetical protein FCR2A7T_05970 [Flavobacterium cauense R2A-7]